MMADSVAEAPRVFLLRCFCFCFCFFLLLLLLWLLVVGCWLLVVVCCLFLFLLLFFFFVVVVAVVVAVAVVVWGHVPARPIILFQVYVCPRSLSTVSENENTGSPSPCAALPRCSFSFHEKRCSGRL